MILNIEFDMDKQIEQDKLLLKSLGGYSKVARMLETSPQRVFNWSRRGIPASVKLEHKELFLKEFSGRRKRKAPRGNVGQG